MAREEEVEILDSLHDWVREVFEWNVFTGPPMAYFELGGGKLPSEEHEGEKRSPFFRGIYRVWALGSHDPLDREILILKFKGHIQDLRSRGGHALFWRRKIELHTESISRLPDNQKPRIYLTSRFIVWDQHMVEVPWRGDNEKPEGEPVQFIVKEPA